MRTSHQKERGQALVLIILAIVGILGISALAIDGGMLYAERRRAQNAADAAVYAGALVRATKGDLTTAQKAALSQATNNGFTSGGETTVVFVNPPESPSPYVGNQAYYQVRITSDVAPIFSQFVFSGKLKYTVEAVARAATPSPFANGAAMFATSTQDGECDALFFGGNGLTTVVGGDVVSSNPTDNGNCTAGQIGGTGDVKMEDGSVRVRGGWRYVGGGEVFGTLVENDTTVTPVDILPPPDCSDAPTPAAPYEANYTDSKGVTKTYTWISPGKYGDFSWKNGDGNLMLKPGMYCIEGSKNGGFSVSGGDVRSYDDPSTPLMEGVFFVVTKGNFSMGGNGTININRADNLMLDGFQWGGWLLYMPSNNTGQVTFGGGSGTTYTGTLYAPGPTTNPSAQPKCIVDGGSGSVGLSAQVVCYSIKVVGNGNVYIKYDPDENAQIPAVVELMN